MSRTSIMLGGPGEGDRELEINEALALFASWLRLFVGEGQVTELRALKVSTGGNDRPHPEGGYFDYQHLDEMVRHALHVTERAEGVYFQINPLNPAVLARRPNRLGRLASGGGAGNGDVMSRRWLFVDVDPQRPPGVSSSKEEKAAALDVACRLRCDLREKGWPDPISADSGNGYHMLYAIDLPADDGGLVRRVLAALAHTYNTEEVKIDQAVANAARLCKLYGSLSRKGDSVTDRPHRRAVLLHVPGVSSPWDVRGACLNPVSRELLLAVADPLPESPAPSRSAGNAPGVQQATKAGRPPVCNSRLKVEEWLRDRGVNYRVKPAPDHLGRTVYLLARCPFNASHGADSEVAIYQAPNGKMGAACMHDGCTGQGWQAFRATIGAPDPEHYDPPLPPKRRTASPSGGRGRKPPPAVPREFTVEILDDAPETIRRPLCLAGSRAFAAAWVWAKVTVKKADDPETGARVVYDPPQVKESLELALVRDDGELFSDGLPNARPLSELGMAVSLPTPIPQGRTWSGAGLKRYLAGERPDPAEVFRRVVAVADRFMDFDRSLGPQETVCELTACYVLASYLLDAFRVIGYLCAGGEHGSGKTSFMYVVAEMSYLGHVLLAKTSFPILRDLADYGACLAFDDAEDVMDPKKGDPDKRALLLAGHRRGTVIPLNEPAGPRGWRTRYVSTFCPRLFSAIRSPDNVLASRTIMLPLVRSSDERRSKASPTDYSVWPFDRRRLVDDLWSVGLTHLPALPEYDATAADRARLSGRNLEPWRAVLAVALWLQERHGADGLFDRLEQLSIDYQAERGEMEAADPTRIAILALQRLLGSQPESPSGWVEFETATLARTMNQVALEEEVVADGQDYTNARRVGWLLKRLRFERAAAGKNHKRWRAMPDRIHALARVHGMADVIAENAETPNQSAAGPWPGEAWPPSPAPAPDWASF